MEFRTKEEAAVFVGGLSDPDKLSCYSFSLPAKFCKTGAKMASTKGTVCNSCYAKKGFYVFRPVQAALLRRYLMLKNPHWVDAMVRLMEGYPYFRWHDSGDVQDMQHLINIVEVANRCPKTKFWLPTHEYSLIAEYVKTYGKFPKNMVVRLSASRVNGKPPIALAKKLNVCVSGVYEKGYNCNAPKQGNKCLDCHKCWNPQAFNTIFKKH